MDRIAFTVTKIQPPRPRANLIERASLELRLAEAIATRRLTLLSAPAGFGKTAALTRQLASLHPETAVAWIAADEDDDLHRFLLCLFRALEPYDLPWRTEPDSLIAAAVDSRPDRRIVVTEVVNALAATDVSRGLIVVDDVHRVPDPAVFEFLDLLLERLPGHWAMVLGSREDPPLALARLRARDELAEVRQSDLRFRHDEVAALVAAAGVSADASQLASRTGGWAAGLRIALNAARSGPAAASQARQVDRDVFDFLAAEVVDRMRPELRDFLIRCSVLPELSAARCAALTGNRNAAELLDEIERRGLFVSVVDGPEPALTLHDLFRACLEDRLRKEHAESLPQLLLAAAQTEPDPIRRLSFLIRANAWDEAERWLEQVAADLLAAAAIEPVLRLLDQFPRERLERSPVLALVHGQLLWAQWDWRATVEAMRRARIGFAQSGDERRMLRAQLFEAVTLDGTGLISDSRARLAELALERMDIETRALALALRTWHAIDAGEFRSVAACYADVLDVLEQTDRLQHWYQCFQRPLYVWLPGMHAPLARFVDGVMRLNGDVPSQMRCIAFVMAAWLALWRGGVGEAAEQIARAQEDARWLGSTVRVRMFVNVAHAAVSAVRGERQATLDALEALLAYFDTAPVSGPSGQPTSMRAHYLFYAVRLADTLGDAGALREFAARIPPPEHITNFVMLRVPLETVPARLAALDGDFDRACALWERVLADEAAIEVIGLAEEARVRYAHTLLALDRKLDAARALKPLLSKVAETGEIGGVLLAGVDVLSSLAGTAWGDTLEWTEAARLRAWAERLRSAGRAADPVNEAADRFGLTSRELQVLERIAAGDSNKTIARALALSPHTVKRHVANILDKLGVDSRRHAAQWYGARH